MSDPALTGTVQFHDPYGSNIGTAVPVVDGVATSTLTNTNTLLTIYARFEPSTDRATTASAESAAVPRVRAATELPFTPGVAKEYTASTTANVISTAGDAALTVSGAGGSEFLTNGAFSLPQPLRVELTPAAWTGPVSNGTVGITFKQAIGANDALRTGAYSKTLTFTLSTTTP